MSIQWDAVILRLVGFSKAPHLVSENTDHPMAPFTTPPLPKEKKNHEGR